MPASKKPLNPNDNDNSLREVIPEVLLPILPPFVGGVAASYIDTADLMEVEEKNDATDAKPLTTQKPIWLTQPLSFWGKSLLQKQILTLVEYAAPLDEVEKYIRQAYARKEDFLQGTLTQAIQRAVISLDHTIRDENGQELRDKGKIVNEGMAERLLKLHAEFFPEKHENALKEARVAAPEESKEEKQKSEEANTNAIGNLFTAFIQNDEKALPEAIETFKSFVKNLKPTVITNNQYYLTLLHLISVAFDVLADRGSNLPCIKGECIGKWFGNLGHRFFSEIIGGALESNLPPRLQQILKASLYYVSQGKIIVDRDLVNSGVLFRGGNTSNLLTFQMPAGWNATENPVHIAYARFGRQRSGFSKLVKSNYIGIQNLLYSDSKNNLLATK